MFVLITEYRPFNVISVCVLVDLADKEFSLLLTEHVCAKEKMLILMYFGHLVCIQ